MIVRQPLRMSPSAGLGGGARRRTRWVPSRSFAAGCGVAVAASSLAVLIGWTFGIARLKNLSPGAVSTKPTAAVALALCGVALALSAMACAAEFLADGCTEQELGITALREVAARRLSEPLAWWWTYRVRLAVR